MRSLMKILLQIGTPCIFVVTLPSILQDHNSRFLILVGKRIGWEARLVVESFYVWTSRWPQIFVDPCIGVILPCFNSTLILLQNISLMQAYLPSKRCQVIGRLHMEGNELQKKRVVTPLLCSPKNCSLYSRTYIEGNGEAKTLQLPQLI